MNKITKTLLAGAALGALATAPAVAGDIPHFNVTARHAGNVVYKTKIRDPNRQSLTYTFGISTSIPASDLDKKIKIRDTFKWNSYSSICSQPKEKFTVAPKKTEYAKIGKYTETYSEGCASGPTLFYGATYKLTNPDGEGKTDHFVSTLIGWFQNNNGKYKGTLNMDFSVSIGE